MSSWKPSLPPHAAFKKKLFTNLAQVSTFTYQAGDYLALRRKSKEIPFKKITSPETQAKIRYIKKALLKYRKITGYGRGITAVQLGIPEKISVTYLSDQLMVVINPKITKWSNKMLEYPEICMSLSPVIVPTVRPEWIEFDYYDEKGSLCHWDKKDKMMNRVLQHEIAHTEGSINIDLVHDPKRIILESDPKFYDTAKFVDVTSR